MYLCRTVDGEETIIDSSTVAGLTYRPGVRLVIRMQTVGTAPTTVRAKVWVAGSGAPDDWTVATTDSGVEGRSAGAVGLLTYVSGSSAAAATFRVDDLWVGEPPQ